MPKTSSLQSKATSSLQGGLIHKLEHTDHALVVTEVAEIFRVTTWTVYRLAKRNAIPSFRFGGSVLFNPQALANWMRNTAGAA